MSIRVSFFNLKKKLSTCQVDIMPHDIVSTTCQLNISVTCQLALVHMSYIQFRLYFYQFCLI